MIIYLFAICLLDFSCATIYINCSGCSCDHYFMYICSVLKCILYNIILYNCIVLYIICAFCVVLYRLWDTTWGNRETGRDESINKDREVAMKQGVQKFNIGLVCANCALTLLFSLYLTSPNVQLIFICILFAPLVIQIAGAVLYLLIITPLRQVFVNRDVKQHGNF
jgi:hypothetical protein